MGLGKGVGVGLDGCRDQIAWLLEDDTPFIKYNTLIEVLGRPKDGPEVLGNLRRMMETPPVSSILRNQWVDTGLDKSAAKNFGAEAARSGYFPKYTGAAWRALFLAQAGAEPGNPEVRNLCEHVLRNAFDGRMGAFGFRLEWKRGTEDAVMPCFIGNMVWALCRLGFSGRREVRESFDFLVKYQRFDDGGVSTPVDWPYRGRRERCWGSHTCYWGVTKMLMAMTAVPKSYWTAEAKEAMRRGVEFVLLHRLMHSSHDPSKPITTKNTRPTRLFAPLTYFDDAIEIASTLLKLGISDPAIDAVVDFVLSKRNERGRWVLEGVPGPLDARFGVKGKESKWVTFRALRMMRLAGRLEVPQPQRSSV
jgi:hypothetical protein